MKLVFSMARGFYDEDHRVMIRESVDYIRERLEEIGVAKKALVSVMISAEESIGAMVEHAGPKDRLNVKIARFFGDVEIILRMNGSEIKPFVTGMGSASDFLEAEDDDVQRAIRAIILKSQSEQVRFSYSDGQNNCRILVAKAEQTLLIGTVFALILGLIAGFLLKYVFPSGICDIAVGYAIIPIRTVFMNALKMIIAPVVFFSIVSCIAQVKDIKELGRIGAKVIGMYLTTTVFAITIALIFSLLLKPGEWGYALSLGNVQEVIVNTDVDTSILSTIVNIVPSNFVRPFLESDTLQIIFLAIICGIAVGKIGEYSTRISDFFDACNSLALAVTSIITGFIPVAVFCSISLTVIQLGAKTFVSLLGLIGTFGLSIFCMLIVYGLLILILGRLNPLVFYKKNREGMLTSFTLASSSAAMPVNMKICTDKLGISPKVCNFSIPLGATINMDGACIFLVTVSMFLARAYGIEVQSSSLTTFIITVIMLSVGAPGVPGVAIVCLGIALNSLGVPLESIGLVMGIYPFLDMFDTMSNTTGDVAAALIVAKNEKLLDMKKYYS